MFVRWADPMWTITCEQEDTKTMKTESTTRTPESQVQSSIDNLDPKHQALLRSVRAAMRKRFPTLNELAYTYATSFVISYSPTEHGIEGIVAIAARTDGVRLYFGQGVQLADPKGLLLGTGRQTRYVKVTAVSELAQPDIAAFFAIAIAQSAVPVPTEGTGTVIIKTDGTQQRARRRRAT
jgi:hypothetical protein